MVLRHDDPLVEPLKARRPIFIVDSNPTVERIARLIFDYASEQDCRSSGQGMGNADVYANAESESRARM